MVIASWDCSDAVRSDARRPATAGIAAYRSAAIPRGDDHHGAMPAVAGRRASPPAAAQRWELRWLVSASGYNRLFSSRRLRFLGDAQGCPAPLRLFVAEQGQTGATLSVFHLQPFDGLHGPFAPALLAGPGTTPRQIPFQSRPAPRFFISFARELACGSARSHLASRGFRG